MVPLPPLSRALRLIGHTAGPHPGPRSISGSSFHCAHPGPADILAPRSRTCAQREQRSPAHVIEQILVFKDHWIFEITGGRQLADSGLPE